MRNSNRRNPDEHRQQQPSAINPMEFAAWLTATYSLDAATLTAEQRPRFETAFDEAAAGRIIASVNGKATMEAGPFEPSDTMDNPADLEAAQAVRENGNRLMEICEITRNHPAIGAEAIRDNWTLVETYRAVGEREAQTAGQYNCGW